MRVLLVEDDELVREVMAEMLDDFGHTIRAASSAEDALGQLAICEIDVILSDIDMPGMSGVKLAQRIRGGNPSARIVLYTGSTNRNLVGLPEGIKVLSKPVNLETLKRAIKEA